MASNKMHHGEVDIGVDLVRALIADQFPAWGDLPLRLVQSAGTVNAIYRLGDDMCVRLPRVRGWASDLVKELQWLPWLAPQLSLAVPVPVASGVPGQGFPHPWAIYRWLDGETSATAGVSDERRAAADLAQFIAALRSIDQAGAPVSTRDRPLVERDHDARSAIKSLRGVVDTDAVTAAWEDSLEAPAWDGAPVWTHGDLLPTNLLVQGGRLGAVVDWGNAGIGDPAIDVIPAWSVLSETGRDDFRQALDVEDAMWLRSRGFALHQALMIAPYYRETNPAFVATAVRTIGQVLVDHAS
jgi:aminoglycoside phosphotransferase (APT) family kinase protein